MARILSLLVLALGLLAGVQGQGPWFNVVTFNAALTGWNNFTEYYAPRRDALINSFSASNNVWSKADVACLQEVVEDDDRLAVASAANAIGFRYAVVNQTVEDVQSIRGLRACDLQRIQALNSCVQSKATSCLAASSTRAQLLCITNFCSQEVAALSQTCINCIIGVGSISALQACATTYNAVDSTTNLGLVLLSKREILHSRLIPFSNSSNLFRRGYIRADVKDVGLVLCTHTYPHFDDLSEQQNAAGGMLSLQQTQILLGEARGREAIILGDLNTSPNISSDDIHPVFEASYNLYGNDGFYSPIVRPVGSRCTFCADNPILVQAGGNRSSSILDHVMIHRGFFDIDNNGTKRVFTENSIPPGNGVPVAIPLSDHYGVQVRMRSSASTRVFSLALVLLMVMAAHLLRQ